MKLNGTFSVRASPGSVFTFLLDPQRLADCIEDPHTLEVLDADRFRGTMKSGIGPVRGTFRWSATVLERAPPDRTRVRVHGSGLGSAFDMDAVMELRDRSGSTAATWQADVTFSGTLASLGARLLQTTIDRKTSAFFENVRKSLEAA